MEYAMTEPLPRSLQDLPRPCARLCLRVRRFLRTLLPEHPLAGPVLVAFSGGADSTALAIILRCLGLSPWLAHLDHGLRSESRAEAVCAARFAQRLNAPFLTETTNVAALARQRSLGIEEAGRVARYRFLEQARRTAGATWIATGHQLDDLCEDQLLRLMRGTGWPGLGGMPAVDARRHLLRPLLATRRTEIEAFLTALNLDRLEDPSNNDIRFTRNRVRHELLPLIRRENPAQANAGLNLWRLARLDEAYWSGIIAPALAAIRQESLQAGAHDRPGEEQPALLLPRHAFVHLPAAVRLRIYMALIRKSTALLGAGQARAETLFRLDECCMTGNGVRRFQFPGRLTLIVRPKGIYLPLERKSAP